MNNKNARLIQLRKEKLLEIDLEMTRAVKERDFHRLKQLSLVKIDEQVSSYNDQGKVKIGEIIDKLISSISFFEYNKGYLVGIREL